MPTIKDVADLANVSIATVSRVLNESGYVKPELETRVRDAIAQLGYQPNVLARNLRRSESMTIGMLIPDSNNPFFAEIARGVEEVSFNNGYTVVLCNTDEKPEREAAYFDALYQQRVAGFVLVSTGKLTVRLRQLQEEGYPIVVLDRPMLDLETDSVISDNYDGARQAVQYLLDQGHRSIGFIIGSTHLETIRSRWAGVQDTMRVAGVRIQPNQVVDNGDFLPPSGYAAAERLINQPDPPTAILAFNDLMAFGVLNYAQTHGISVPTQLSVIGFDDIMMASYVIPALTTVSQHKYELGRRGAEILIRRIQGNKTALDQITVPTQLIVRQSTAPCERIFHE